MQSKQLSRAFVLALLSSAGLIAGTAHAYSPTPPTTPTAAPTYPSWNATTVYNGGDRVSHNGATYEAKWWTQGDNPGQSDEWGPWKRISAATPIPSPSPTPKMCPVTTLPPMPTGWVATPIYGADGCITGWNTFPGVTPTPITTPTASPSPTPTASANQAPSVTLTSVWGNYMGIAMDASASDADGRVAKVDFYIDDTLVSSSTNAPYQYFRSGPISYSIGSVHTAYAIATDNQGATTKSNVSSFTVISDALTPPPTTTPTITPSPTPTATPPVSACADTPWNSGTAYTGGQKVSFNGRTYQAQWWTLNEQPNLNTGSGKPWKDLGACAAPTATPVSQTPVPTPVPTSCPPIARPTPPGPGYVWVPNGCFGQWVLTTTQSPTPTVSVSPSPTPTPISKPVLESAQITTWKNGAKGAYSLVHDDYCSMYYGSDPYINLIDPELKKRGLVAGFGMITGSCSPQHWAAAKQFIANGHEIVSHTRNHPNPYTTDAELETELNGSAADISANLDGYKASYFIWPSDAASTVGTNFLKNNTAYLGGRASHLIVDGTVSGGTVDYTTMPAGVNTADFDNPFRIKWDLFTTDGQWSLYPMGSEILNLHIDAAISQGGWATRTMHSVDTGYYQTAPLARYQAHLDYAKAKVGAGELWMDTPSNVIKYRFARENCQLIVPAVVGNNMFGFNLTAACQKYATPLTMNINASNVLGTLVVMQNGKSLPVKVLSSSAYWNAPATWQVTVDPLAGNVTLHNGQ